MSERSVRVRRYKFGVRLKYFQNGGLSSFVQQFLNEVLGILRSHVGCLGGNAVTSYFLSYCVINYFPHRNQAQCLVNVGGDVVSVQYVVK